MAYLKRLARPILVAFVILAAVGVLWILQTYGVHQEPTIGGPNQP